MRSAFPKLFSALLALFASVSLFAQQAPPDRDMVRVEPQTQPADLTPRVAAIARAASDKVASVLLDRPSSQELAQLRSPSKEGVPLQVGFGRSVASLQDEAGLQGKLAWTVLTGGRQVAAVSIRSPDASAVRAGLRIVALPSDAILRFYAPGGEVFDASAEDVLETITRNLDAGEQAADARIYWSPVVEADTIVVEFELPASTPASALHVAIPQLSHLVTNATRDFVMEKAAASCELDVMCYSAWSVAESNAVARMLFTDAGSSYLCSGTLLNDRDTSTTIPYFLSANHCISNQTAASTLQTYWFYRSTACGGVLGNYQTLTGGATLLYASNTTDTSFMRLNSTPPAGAIYAGWAVSPVPPISTTATAIHHPAGDKQKISFANISAYATCTPPTNGSFNCSTTSSPTSQTFYGVQWSQGITEPGSSGSGLFLDNGHYLIGQLYGGSSSCTNVTATDFYGRFDVAYNAALSQWLGVTGTTTNYTLTIASYGTGLGVVTSSPAGLNCGATCATSFAQGTTVSLTPTPAAGSIFGGWSGACSGTGACSVAMNANASVGATFNSTANMPSAPQSVAAIAGNTQATFTFTPPANNGGSPIARYTVSCSPGSFSASGTGSPIAIGSLTNGVAYTCTTTATNATTTGAASNAVIVTPSAAAATALIAAMSRKTNGNGQTYNLSIDTAKSIAQPQIEPRAGNPSHLIVFAFNNPVTTAGTVSVADKNGAATGSVSVTLSGGEVRVQLSGIPDDKRITVSLSGVNGSLDVSASIGFLVGDVTGSNLSVTASDILMSRGRSGQSVNTTNFGFDVDNSGTIDANDVNETTLRAGMTIP